MVSFIVWAYSYTNLIIQYLINFDVSNDEMKLDDLACKLKIILNVH